MRNDEVLTFVYDGGSVEFSQTANYFWKDQDGMGGLSADIYTSQKVARPGVTVTGKHTAARLITVTAQINERLISYAAGREALMRAIRPGLEGNLVYEDSLYTRYIPCVVRTAPEPNRDIFAQFEIEFFCASPFWRGGDGDTKTLSGIAAWIDNWEFPFEIPAEGLELTYRAPSLLSNIVNEGDEELPLTIRFIAASAVDDPILTNVVTQEYITVDYSMLAGDVITIETDDDLMSVTLLRGGVETNLFNYVPEECTWLKLAVGDNYLRVGASTDDYISCELEYDDGRYDGV